MSVIKQRFATAASRLAPLQRLGEERLRSGYSVADRWEELVDHQGEAACLVQVADGILPARQLSFNEAEALANELAHAISTLTLRTGDAVALMFDNRVEFVALWIGLSKLGLVSAWINNAIKGGPLVHSISAAKSKLLVFGVEHAEAVESVSQELGQAGILLLSMSGGVSFCKCLDDLLPRSPSHRPSRDARAMVKYTDTMCYIYTSGTTGLPKASLISHQKFCSTGLSARAMLTPADIVYGSGMPLYHSSAGMVGIGYMMGVGCCYIIRRRFSASAWIGDVKQHKVTVVQYIGELARYLLTVPEQPDDGDNNLLFATGNGLRPEYWDRFQLRYGIDCVQEFYGSTEGTLGFTNRQFLEDLRAGKRVGYGAVGRLRDPRMIICKFDVEAEQLLRGADGLCRQAAVDEAGELLVRITSTTRFAGYTDPSATEKKLACDVLEKGDRYFRTGDLLRVDAERFVYFVDRIGDTFRWKGENVSTAEVASELAKLPGIEDVNVYGVQIPNTDGRAGCCAMVMADTSSDALARFHQHATASLPAYAVPLFLRVLPRMQTTETFKHQKVQLRNEGVDPSKIEDSLYFLDEGKYQLLDDAAYQRLTQPSSRL